MVIIDYESLAEDISQLAHPLRGNHADYDPLMELIDDADIVLLGEASHGTHEFYRARAEITRRLIAEKDFAAVAVEADWPDAYRVNRFIRGLGSDRHAEAALTDFQRFPVWMWRNREILTLVDWLRTHNRDQSETRQVGFYGLDLYSLYNSIQAVVDYLQSIDPEAAQRARERYACFDHAGGAARQYGHNVLFGSHPDCEAEAVQQLRELREQRDALVKADGLAAVDEQFAAEQNALLVKNAEAYYRAMFGRSENTWNLRDQHMSDTLDALQRHLAQQDRPAKIIVWAHNSHIGDASATDRSRHGEHNVGQLVRRRHGKNCRLIGFTTYHGTVTAASDWDGPTERKQVRPALRGSYEDLLHSVNIQEFFLDLRQERIAQRLREPMLQRFIGVIYLPQTERMSHYYNTNLSDQYDALFHFDTTRALEPLDRISEWTLGEAPDTYPSGL